MRRLRSTCPPETNRPDGYKENLQELWNATGFQNVEMKRLAIQMDFKSFDDFWVPYLAGVGPGGTYVATLSTDRQSALRDLLHERLYADKPDGPFTLHAHAWAVRGNRSAVNGIREQRGNFFRHTVAILLLTEVSSSSS